MHPKKARVQEVLGTVVIHNQLVAQTVLMMPTFQIALKSLLEICVKETGSAVLLVIWTTVAADMMSIGKVKRKV